VIRLETARLLLREMRADDADALLAVLGDPVVMEAFAAPPFGHAEMERWIARNLEHQRAHGYGLFTVVHRASGLVIGDCGLEQMDVGAELGYDLRADHWGQGYATEAASAVRDLAFGALALPRIVSLVRVGNVSSRRVAEKVGMSVREELTRHRVRYWLLELAAPSPSLA
jgi:ribosomal-protein-alanine N-acetyltransferase